MTTIEDFTKRFKIISSNYEELLAKCEESILLEGISLKEALKSQLQLQMDWEVVSKRITYLCDQIENEMETAYAEAIKKELKDSYRSTSISEAKEFAKTDPDYKALRKLYINVKYTRDEARGVLDTVNSRKYLLNNMSNAIVASVEDTIL